MTFADTVSGMSYKMVLESAIMAAKKKKKQTKQKPEESITHPESSEPKTTCTYLRPAREKTGTKMGRF